MLRTAKRCVNLSYCESTINGDEKLDMAEKGEQGRILSQRWLGEMVVEQA